MTGGCDEEKCCWAVQIVQCSGTRTFFPTSSKGTRCVISSEMALPVTLSGSQVVLGVKMRPAKAKPPSYTKLSGYVKYLQKVPKNLWPAQLILSQFFGAPQSEQNLPKVALVRSTGINSPVPLHISPTSVITVPQYSLILSSCFKPP